ncbi:MAG: type I-E CRISPR-associated endoribonuclease Cas2e [Lachnospiraceae bacterium]|nr:type I-E CRISPR-associated endoribonuclease Cas2e [Lachnospiraceae bacterium]
MPFTVITLKNVPPSLRGDLTKWMQEISTGVYVGNYNSRIREYLWKRVCDSVGSGEATISYSCHNEIGYSFESKNTGRTVIDSDGIPLILLPADPDKEDDNKLKKGFSNAYKMHRAHISGKAHAPERARQTRDNKNYVVLDIETTGLNAIKDDIIEIGAVKSESGKLSFFHQMIDIHKQIPDNISKLTGITNDMISGAMDIKSVLPDLMDFIGELPLVGYNIGFDILFINVALDKNGLPALSNRTIDLLERVKKEKLFQVNYKLSTTLHSYGIDKTVPHRALEDAKLILELSKKVNIF